MLYIKLMKISVIGIGRLGGALAIALSKNGFEIVNLFARNKENAEKIAVKINSRPQILTAQDFSKISSEVVLITTQDSEIAKLSADLLGSLPNNPFVFHTSGALSSEILSDLKKIGCRVGSIHPLVSISDSILGAKRFSGAYFCVEGDDEAIKIANQIVESLGGKTFFIETKFKALYHASAVTACGHLVALMDVAIEMLTKCGLSETNARQILLPLIESTIENLSEQTTARALTGTFARADIATLEKHIEALRENVSAEAFGVYLQLGNRSLHLAREQDASKEDLETMREKISLAKKNLKC